MIIFVWKKENEKEGVKEKERENNYTDNIDGGNIMTSLYILTIIIIIIIKQPRKY